MKGKRIDFEAMLPSYSASIVAMRRAASRFMHCPKGHPLPHRVSWGRCSPIDCIDYGQPGTKANPSRSEARSTSFQNQFEAEMALLPIGGEQTALMPSRRPAGVLEAEASQAQSEEAIEVSRAYGRSMAREGVHPMPDIPEPPDLKKLGPSEYVKARLEQVKPYLVEAEIFDLKFGTKEERRAAKESLLSRAGVSRNPEGAGVNHAPLIINFVGPNPYDQQEREINGQAQVVSKDPRIGPTDRGSERPASDAAARSAYLAAGERGEDGDPGSSAGEPAAPSAAGTDPVPNPPPAAPAPAQAGDERERQQEEGPTGDW